MTATKCSLMEARAGPVMRGFCQGRRRETGHDSAIPPPHPLCPHVRQKDICVVQYCVRRINLYGKAPQKNEEKDK